MEEPPGIGKDKVQDHLWNLKVHKSIEPEEMHPQILRKLTDEVAKPFSILSEQLRQASEVPSDWKRGHKIPTFKNGKKENPGNTGQLDSPKCLARSWRRSSRKPCQGTWKTKR